MRKRRAPLAGSETPKNETYKDIQGIFVFFFFSIKSIRMDKLCRFFLFFFFLVGLRISPWTLASASCCTTL